MIIPMILPVSHDAKTLEHRIEQLEKALSQSLVTMQSIAGVLEDKFGQDCLPDEVKAFTSQMSAPVLNKLISDIDSACHAGDKPAAARQIRTALACTWDEANQVVKHWHSYQAEQKISWLRIACLLKASEG